MSDNNEKLKSRRSSILKPPKPRNPLSDVDLNPPSETTIMKSRRVSFANVRFKKEFTADPEKNTIWHTSYEEEMNKSDKSELNEIRAEQSCSNEPDINISDKDMSLDSDVMNCTHMHLDNSLETALTNNSDSSISSAVIDLTKCKKAPLLVNTRSQPHFEEIQQTCLIETLPGCSKRTTIHYQQEDLEFTETVSVNLNAHKPNRQTINFKTHPQNADMDMTHVVASDYNYNNEFEGASMEITKSIPSHIRNQNKALYRQERQTINFKYTEIDHMEVTQAVPVDIQENKRQTIHFRETENDELDFTEYIPSNVIVNKKRQTINFKNNEPEGDMDFTLNINEDQQNTMKRRTIHFNRASQDSNMEMTEVIPSEMLVTPLTVREDKENIYAQNICQKPTTKRQTINFNQTSQDANMEFTEIIPTEMLVTAQAVIQDKENIFTQKAHQKPTTKRQTINYNQTSQDANMEITEIIPTKMLVTAQAVNEDKENIFVQKVHQKPTTKRQTINFNQTSQDANMEFTEIIPTEMLVTAQAVNEDKENIFAQKVHQKPKKKRQTINFNQTSQDSNMELTEVVPAEMILALACRKALPIEDKENIPFDPAYFDITAKENEHKNRQTIVFNQTEAANMDITENIAMNLQNACGEENILSNFSRKKPTRQTIHYNNQDGGTMELTENIPAYLSQNAKAQSSRQTILFNNADNDLEMTENIPVHVLQNAATIRKEKQDRRTIHFNTQDAGNMEITQNIPTNLTETTENQKLNRQTIYFNTQDTANMEITGNIPVCVSQNVGNNKNRRTINFNSQDSGNMDFTENIPTNLAQNNINQKQNHQTIHFNRQECGNMEFTENIPTNIIKEKQNRQTIHFNNEDCGNMDFTENIPTNLAQNIIKEKQNRQTIHFNSQESGNMEFTENIPSNLAQTIIKANQNRQTINFNNPNPTSMDLTQNLLTNCAQNSPQTKKKQTVFFNQSENLDITENIPNVIHDIKETEKTSQETINMSISEHIDNNSELKQVNISETEEFGTNFAQNNVETEKVNYFTNPLCEKTEKTENIQELLMEEALHFDTVGNTSKVPKIRKNESVSFKFSQSETGNCATLQNNFSISINFTQNNEKSLNIPDTFNLTKYLENAQPETVHQEVESQPHQSAAEDPNTHCKIFRFTGQPLILDPNSEEQNSSDICQRIKLPGQKEDFTVSKINLTDKLDFTPIQNSFNLTDNLNSMVDSTEKLINCKIDLPASEYSKIISEEIDRNYSIINTSFPEHLEISSATENSEDGRNHSCIEESHNKLESIISVNSSIESFEKMDDIEKLYDQITLPPKIDCYFNLEDELATITYFDKSECEEIIMLKNLEKERGNIEEKIRLFLNINENTCQEDSTFVLPKYDNVNEDDKKRDKIFQRFQEFVDRKMKKQESTVETKPLTLLDKIKHMHNNNTLWDLIPDSEYSFTYMDETIKFDVQMEPNSEIVKQVKFYSQLEESEYKPIGRYNYKILMPKLTEEKIKSAVGDRYTIFSLLDYVSKVGDESVDILKEFQHIFFNIGMKLDDNSNATLLFTDLFLRLQFEVTFNLNDLHNINPDMITVKNLVSNADENALRRLIKLCPSGVAFIRKYNQLVEDYLKFKSNTAQQTKK